MPGFLATLLGSVGQIASLSSENIFIVYWLSGPNISPYGVLATCNIWFPLFFGVMLCSYAAYSRDWTLLTRLTDPGTEKRGVGWRHNPVLLLWCRVTHPQPQKLLANPGKPPHRPHHLNLCSPPPSTP